MRQASAFCSMEAKGPACHTDADCRDRSSRGTCPQEGRSSWCRPAQSDIDSVLIGYIIYQLGLPPFPYGAGLNLFQNPLLSFMMSDLGAYTVDRRESNLIHKQTLKNFQRLDPQGGHRAPPSSFLVADERGVAPSRAELKLRDFWACRSRSAGRGVDGGPREAQCATSCRW
jgi:hypothetical protein